MEESRKDDFYHQAVPVIVLTTFEVQCIHLQHTFVSYHNKITQLFCFVFQKQHGKNLTHTTISGKNPTILPIYIYI